MAGIDKGKYTKHTHTHGITTVTLAAYARRELRPVHNMTQEPASPRHNVNRQIATRRDAGRRDARIVSSALSATLTLCPTNQISAKKHVTVLRVLYRVGKRIVGFVGGLHIFLNATKA